MPVQYLKHNLEAKPARTEEEMSKFANMVADFNTPLKQLTEQVESGQKI